MKNYKILVALRLQHDQITEPKYASNRASMEYTVEL